MQRIYIWVKLNERIFTLSAIRPMQRIDIWVKLNERIFTLSAIRPMQRIDIWVDAKNIQMDCNVVVTNVMYKISAVCSEP